MVITLRERRLTSGFDHYVPIILRDGVVYDGQLDRFFLDLPLNGVRSPHTLRAYGYDIMVWVRFLEEARGKAVWNADAIGCRGVSPRASARRCWSADKRRFMEPLRSRLSRSSTVGPSWKVIVAFQSIHPSRCSGGRGHGSRIALASSLATRPMSARPSGRMSASFPLEDYRVFRDVGLRGLTSDGSRAARRQRSQRRAQRALRRVARHDRVTARGGVVPACLGVCRI